MIEKIFTPLLFLSLLLFSGCLDKDSVSGFEPSTTTTTSTNDESTISDTSDSDTVESPKKETPPSIEVVSEDQDDKDSENESKTEEEINKENEEKEDMSKEEEENTPDKKDPKEEEEFVSSDDPRCKKEGSLISNGSFEIVDNRKGLIHGKPLDSIAQSGWDVYKSLPSGKDGVDSWYTSDGAGIEIQGHNVVAQSPSGMRSVELDSHGKSTNSTMSQKVYLCRGKYTLRFLYYARTKTKGDNAVEVSLNGIQIKKLNKTHNGKWLRVRRSIKVTKAGEYTLSFAAKGKENSLGGLIDHVRRHRKVRRAGVVTSLLALGDKDNINEPMIKEEVAKAIISKLVSFASPVRKPKILVIKDDGHNGESTEDFALVEQVLKEKYGEENIKIQEGELRRADAVDFNVVYVINPGHPLKRQVTADTLKELIKERATGVILSGDDLARGRSFSLEDITGAKYLNNGVRACNVYIDNNKGKNYEVKLRKRFFKRLNSETRTLAYGNDIDHVQLTRKKVRILARSTFQNGSCKVSLPTVFGYKLKKP